MPLDTGDPGRGREADRPDALRPGRLGRPAPPRALRPARADLPARDRPPRRRPDPGPHRPRVPQGRHARDARAPARPELTPPSLVKVAFAGTPDFAATVLRGLVSSDHEVGLVVSQPDARRGRGRKEQPTPVAELTRTLGLPLRQPARISEVSSEISDLDALVVAAYGQILRADTLYATRGGAWNVHASLLPKYRGA